MNGRGEKSKLKHSNEISERRGSEGVREDVRYHLCDWLCWSLFDFRGNQSRGKKCRELGLCLWKSCLITLMTF